MGGGIIEMSCIASDGICKWPSARYHEHVYLGFN
jgi:hypothetical protein